MTAHRNHVTAGDVINVYRDGKLVAENMYIISLGMDGVFYQSLDEHLAGSQDQGVMRYHDLNAENITIEKVKPCC